MDDRHARIRALVRGRVQGVFFRDFARNSAQGVRVSGWVRNLSDGCTLEVVAEGSRKSLEALLADLRSGPPRSFVEDVEVEWSAATGEFRGFTIR